MSLYLTILTAVLLLSCFTSITAQTNPEKEKIYNTCIKLSQENYSQKVNLYDLGDSTISISHTYLVKEEDLIIYPIDKIQLIEARGKGKVWKGLLFGYLGGVGAELSLNTLQHQMKMMF